MSARGEIRLETGPTSEMEVISELLLCCILLYRLNFCVHRFPHFKRKGRMSPNRNADLEKM